MKKLIAILLLFVSSITFAQGPWDRWVTTSGTNTYTATITTPSFPSSYNNTVLRLVFANGNTGASTININSIGAAPVRRWDGDSWEPLVSGDIPAGGSAILYYDNTNSYYEAIILENIGSGSGGTTGELINETQTGSTYTVTDADAGKMIHFTNASGVTVTLPNTLTADRIFNFTRDEDAGIITFVGSGGAVLNAPALTLEVPSVDYPVVCSWSKVDATRFDGFGQLGTASGGSGDLTVGTTVINSGTTTRVLYDNAGVLGEYTVSGTGNVAMTTSPVFTTPNIGTATGSITGNAATVTTNANLTGHVTSTGNAAVLGSFSSSNLSTAVTDESGSGLLMFSERTANVQTASYPLVLSDRSGEVYMNVATANDVTVPTNASVAFPVGTKITIIRTGAGATSVVASGGVTINSSSGTLAGPSRYNLMMLTKTGTDEWYLWNGEPAFAGAALTATDGMFDFTVNNGSTALLNAANFTATLNGLSSIAVGDLISANATNTFTQIAAVTAGRYLRSAGTSTLPVWSTLSLPNSLNANRILYGTSANTAGEDADLTFDGTILTTGQLKINTGATITGHLSNTATLNFDLTAVNYQDLTITVTGAADGDVVTIGVPNGAVVADVTYFGWVSATNTVSIRCSRVGGGGAADPASGTFRASVTKY